jgi:hypothetical protein
LFGVPGSGLALFKSTKPVFGGLVSVL